MIKFGMQHLYFMLRIRSDRMKSTKTFYKSLGTRKTLLFTELREVGLLTVEEEGDIYLSERGDKVIDETIFQFNQLTQFKS